MIYRWIGVKRSESAEPEQKIQEQLMQVSKMASLGMLAAGIAHELNNPLTIILGQTQLMQMKCTDPELWNGLKPVLEAGQRAKDIVQNVLEFSHAQRPQFETVNIHKMIHKAISLFGKRPSIYNIEIKEHFHSSDLWTNGDTGQLQQLVLNIIQNSCDAIISTHAAGTIEITTRPTETGRISISISDNGPGISESIRQRIFDPFFTTKPPGKGTGLGLSICYQIIQRHHGAISVRSEEGAGTKFMIELPEIKLQSIDMPQSFDSGNQHDARLRCLLIDAENKYEQLREKLAFSDLPLECVVATDLSRAIEQLHSDEIDVIFVHINEHKVLRDMLSDMTVGDWRQRIVFITDFPVTNRVAEQLQMDGFRWIEKNCHVSELREIIYSCVEVAVAH
jgi:two-component sensor histidine kinase